MLFADYSFVEIYDYALENLILAWTQQKLWC